MYNMNVSIDIIPRTKVIGLFEDGTFADMVAKDFKSGKNGIYRIMSAILSTDNVIVMIEGETSV